MIDYKKLEFEISRIIKGKEKAIKLIISSMLAEGHVLIEDIPGVGKTTLGLTISKVLSLSFGRVQFTADLMPSDIIGVSIFDNSKREFVFKPGPIFNNIILADEINRASPKTQSALLEAMAEKSVTVDGKTYSLENPFFVIATQNPIESYGTFPLPESQLDRFMIKISLGYPDKDTEKLILSGENPYNRIQDLRPLFTKSDIIETINHIKHIYVSEEIIDLVLKIGTRTRSHPMLRLGVSTRALISLISLSKAFAFVNGRDFVVPSDIYELSPIALSHRVITSFDETDPFNIIKEIVEENVK